MERSGDWNSKMRPAREPKITRVSCAYAGCDRPPSFGASGHSAYCVGHKKQRDRGQKMRPLRTYRNHRPLDERWQEWAERRASVPSKTLGLRHNATCVFDVRVLATNHNGRMGWRYVRCPDCARRFNLSPTGVFHPVRSAGARSAK